MVDGVKIYGEGETAVRALRGVSLRIERGQFTAIMGPSGSGKSTLLHTLAELDTLEGGEVFIDGTALSTLKDRDLTLGPGSDTSAASKGGLCVLSNQGQQGLWALTESNRRPLPCKGSALPSELNARPSPHITTSDDQAVISIGDNSCTNSHSSSLEASTGKDASSARGRPGGLLR